MLLSIVHLIALANFAYALYFDIFLVQLPPTAPRFQVSYFQSYHSNYHLTSCTFAELNFTEFHLNVCLPIPL